MKVTLAKTSYNALTPIKRFSTLLFFLFCFLANTLEAQLHQPVSCKTNYNLIWDTTPTNADEVNWSAPGALSNSFTNVDHSGVDVSITFDGHTSTLGDWNNGGGPTTPLVGTNASNGGQEVLQYFTNGFDEKGITITIEFSEPITEVGFDMFHVNGAGPFGDKYTITAATTIGSTIFPIFTESANPSYTTDNTTGIVNSFDNSTAGTNAMFGVNFSSPEYITAITLVWDECNTCTPGAVHGSGIGNFTFCKIPIDTDNDGIADDTDLDDDNDGILDTQELCGTNPMPTTTSTIEVSINLDNYPTEITWNITGPSGVVKTGGPYANGQANTTVNATFEAVANGTYTFNIYDTWGDGIMGNTYTISGDDFASITNSFDSPGSTQSETIAITSANNSIFSCLDSDPMLDDDGDGIFNFEDADFCTLNANGVCENLDMDGDGIINSLDLDADNDGITDVVENASGDTFEDNGSGGVMDGIVDNFSDVNDANGWNDNSTYNITDTDGDGVPDFLDIDADNDGIPDYIEGTCSTCPTFGPAMGGDSDGDGILDIYENITTDNTNNTSGANAGVSPNLDDDAANAIPDYLDTDTDNDGSPDWIEGYDSNDDGSGADDIIAMAATYETNTDNGYYTTVDSDNDGLPDWLDNQPFLAGYDATARPPFLDPTSTFWQDNDGDGLVDVFDTDQGGVAAPTPDNNGIDDLDWRDVSTGSALPVELSLFTGSVDGCNTQLIWRAETEEAFSHYELEWSADGINYNILKRINGAGGLTQIQTYQYRDEKAAGENYYRLKMVDLDASFEYSSVVYLRTDCSEAYDMTVYPNPVSIHESNISVKFFTNEAQAELIVVDLLGHTVRSLNLQTERSWNTVQINISDLPIGIYFVKQLGPGNKIAKRFIIQE